MNTLTTVLTILWTIFATLLGMLVVISSIGILSDDDTNIDHTKLVIVAIFFEAFAIFTTVCLWHHKPPVS